MSRKSLWTPEAEDAFHAILAYLQVEWDGLVAEAFATDVYETIALLEVFPYCGVGELPEKVIRSIPVARQVRLFYRVAEDAIIVLELVDTRSERLQAMRM